MRRLLPSLRTTDDPPRRKRGASHFAASLIHFQRWQPSFIRLDLVKSSLEAAAMSLACNALSNEGHSSLGSEPRSIRRCTMAAFAGGDKDAKFSTSLSAPLSISADTEPAFVFHSSSVSSHAMELNSFLDARH